MIYLRLFFEFFKAGLFAVGGGYATLPFVYDMSERLGRFTYEEAAGMAAVSASAPGPFGANLSAYAGYMTCGIGGAAVAVAGLITPSVITILIISLFLDRFRNSFGVKSAFYGLRPASAALIASVLIFMLYQTLVNPELFSAGGKISDLLNIKSIVLAGSVLILTNIKYLKKLHPIFFIASSAACGIIFGFAGT